MESAFRSEESSSGPTVREKMEGIVTNIRENADKMAHDAADSANEYYRDANIWLQENYGKALSVVGIVAAVAYFGYSLGRRRSSAAVARSRGPGMNAPAPLRDDIYLD